MEPNIKSDLDQMLAEVLVNLRVMEELTKYALAFSDDAPSACKNCIKKMQDTEMELAKVVLSLDEVTRD